MNHDANGQSWNAYAADHGLKGGAALFMRLASMIQRTGAFSTWQFGKLLEARPFPESPDPGQGINLCIQLLN